MILNPQLSQSSALHLTDRAALMPVSDLTTSLRSPSHSTSILFIDSGVDDLQTLVSGAIAGTEVHVLRSGEDAIGQITNTLLGRSGIASLQIVSHSRSGGLQLGARWLDVQNLPSYVGQLKSWGAALTESADLLLYGCNVGADASGQAFVSLLAQATGADVAASDDLTGNAALGGDWDLEVKTGAIETPLAFKSDTFASYNHILPVSVAGFTESVYVSSLGAGVNGSSLTVDPITRTLYFVDASGVANLRKVAPDKTISTVNASYGAGNFFPYAATDIQFSGGFVYSSLRGNLFQVNTTTGASTQLTTLASMPNYESGIAVNGNSIYVTSGNTGAVGQIVQYNLATNVAATVITGTPVNPLNIKYDPFANKFYFSANPLGFGSNTSFYQADPTAGTFSLLSASALNSYGRFAVDPAGQFLYSRDNSGNVNRISTVTGAVTTFETGLSANAFNGLAFGTSSSGSGISLYVMDNNRIMEVSGFPAPNAVPTIALPSGAIAYSENAIPILLDATATVVDSDAANFDTGTLTVRMIAGANPSDRLAIRNQGTGAGQISLDGRKVLYEGTQIGIYTGGIGTDNLVITFNVAATPVATQALVQNLTYANVSDNPDLAPRALEIILTDGDGGTSTAATKTINLTSSNDAALIARREVLYDGTAASDTQGWTNSTAGSTATTSGGVTTLTTTPAVPYAGYSRTDRVLDATAGFVLEFQANVLTETLTATADKNADGKTDRANFSLTLVTSDNTKAIELGFTQTVGGLRIFAQEDGMSQVDTALAPDAANPTRQLFTQAEGVDIANPGLGNYQIYIKDNSYTLLLNGTAILSGNLRNYKSLTGAPDPYETANLIAFSDNTTSASGSFSLGTVTLLNGGIADQIIDEDTATPALTFGTFDIEGNAVTVSASSSHPAVVPDANVVTAGTGALRTVTVTPIGNANGTSNITLTANDGTTNSTDVFAVAVNAVNDAPTINGTPGTTIDEDAVYSFIPTANDVDAGATLTFSIVNPPTWATFSTITGELAGTPTNDDVGTTNGIVISVSDGTDTTALSAFDLTVTNTNDPPIISGTPATTIDEDTPYTFIPTAADVDTGATLTYAIANQPTWATFNPLTGELSGTPVNADVGTVNGIVISVSDGPATTALPAFDLVVNNVNDAPTAFTLTNTVTTIAENTDTTTRLKVADLNLVDVDGGSNTFELTGTDRDNFEIDGTVLYLKAGTVLNFEAQASYDVGVSVSDPTIAPLSTINVPLTIALTNQNDPTQGTVTIVGNNRIGNTLSIINPLTDEDGIASLSYQWQQSSDGTNWTDIVNGNSESFLLTAAQLNQRLRLQITSLDGQNNTETIFTDPSAPVLGITVSNNLTTTAGMVRQTIDNWATDLTQPGYAAGSRYVVTIDRPERFAQLPTLSATGQLTYEAKPYVNVNTLVNLTIQVQQGDGTIDANLTKTATLNIRYRPEALIRNSATNEVGLLYIDQVTQLQAQRNLTQAGQNVKITPEWAIADTADFNRDGIADILLHNQSGDEVSMWMMGANGQVMATHALQGQDGNTLKTGNLNWKVVGFADIDRDNILDIVWHNQVSDEVAFWFMDGNGISVRSYDYLRDGNGAILKTGNPLWQAKAIADFDGDGDADLLLQLKELNQTAIVQLNSKALVDYQYITSPTESNLVIRGVGDSNADGVADIYWQTPDNSRVLIQTITTLITASNFTPIAATAPLQAIGDLDWNNTADLLFRNVGLDGLLLDLVNPSPPGRLNAPLQQPGRAFQFGDSNWNIVQTDDFGDVVVL